MTEFLHGVETLELLVGPRPVQQVRSAVIGIVGTAPVHHVEDPPDLGRPVLVASDRDNPQLGPQLLGYTLPDALIDIQDQGAGLVVAINVFDPSRHKEDVAAADYDLVEGAAQLPHGDLLAVTVKSEGGVGESHDEGDDYTVDRVTGVIAIVPGGALAEAEKINVAYTRADPSAVDDEDIVGGTNDADQRVGLQALLDVQSLYGFAPKIVIAPGFSDQETVQAALQVIVQKMRLRGIALCDAPVGATRDEVLGARGPGGDFSLVQSDDRVFYCYPHLRSGARLSPLSARMAGVIARTDAERGYWHSPSNKPLLGVTGVEQHLTASITDPQCDVNRLNAAGVVTVFAGHGLGFRVWGNRASSFPGSSAITTFMSVRRTIDMVDESVERFTLQHLDGPIGPVLIGAVLDDVNEFIRTLVTRGALVAGSRVEYFPEDNPPSQLANGHIVFTKTMCPPPPAERITYKSIVDTKLLRL